MAHDMIEGQGLREPAYLFRKTSDPHYDFDSVSLISATQSTFPSPLSLQQPYSLLQTFSAPH